MSEIMTRGQVKNILHPTHRRGNPEPDVHGAAFTLQHHYLALLDAHDAALEALRFYADSGNWDAGEGVVIFWGEDAKGHGIPDQGRRARAALAAVATPQGQEVGDEV